MDDKYPYIPPRGSTPPPTYTPPTGHVQAPQPPVASQKPKRDGLRSILTTVLILLIAPLLALAITNFGFQSYEVDGPSMEPTLYTHDRLIIWKAGRTWSRITKDEYIPKRGTVIVFIKRGLYDFQNNKEKQLIKRVIALPGERVTVQNGSLLVYNDENPDGFNPDAGFDYQDEVQQTVSGNVDITVPAGHIFVVGDNRDNSLDSRSFGSVPVSDIVGSLSARILPLSEAEKF